MNIFPCKLICKYNNPPYRKIVLSPYVIDSDSALKLSRKFIKENKGYSLHSCSIYLVSGDGREAAKYVKNNEAETFEEIHNGYESNTCS